MGMNSKAKKITKDGLEGEFLYYFIKSFDINYNYNTQQIVC